MLSSNLYDSSVVTKARCYGDLLEPTTELYNFGEWVLSRYLQLLSRSYTRLSTLPQMISCVYNSYIANLHPSNIKKPPNLPSCHNVPYLIIKLLGRRVLSVYCLRLTSSSKRFRPNPSIPLAGIFTIF